MLSAVAPTALDSRDRPPLRARPPTPTTLHTPRGAASLQGRAGQGRTGGAHANVQAAKRVLRTKDVQRMPAWRPMHDVSAVQRKPAQLLGAAA